MRIPRLDGGEEKIYIGKSRRKDRERERESGLIVGVITAPSRASQGTKCNLSGSLLHRRRSNGWRHPLFL